jgi:pimeloyl-ACP methyl ester carboxylesterase
MLATTFCHDMRPEGGKFQVMGVRYAPEKPRNEGVTLVLAHGNAMHKEIWRTLLEYLFDLTETQSEDVAIREAWCIECPNHGESAVLNEGDIARHFPEGNWSAWEYPKAILSFMRSRPGNTDFYERNVIAVGHSNGGSAILVLESLDPRIFKSFLLLDPAVSRPQDEPTRAVMERMITPYTWLRQDTWIDRKAARKVLQAQEGTRYWHPKVLDVYVDKALRTHPAAKFPAPYTFNGVTLACTKAYESAMTRSSELFILSFDIMQKLFRSDEKQVHLILATLDKFGVSSIADACRLPEPVFGRTANSCQTISKGGHMFVQTQPEAAAKTVYNAIRSTIRHQIQVQTQSRADTDSRRASSSVGRALL